MSPSSSAITGVKYRLLRVHCLNETLYHPDRGGSVHLQAIIPPSSPHVLRPRIPSGPLIGGDDSIIARFPAKLERFYGAFAINARFSTVNSVRNMSGKVCWGPLMGSTVI